MVKMAESQPAKKTKKNIVGSKTRNTVNTQEQTIISKLY